MIDKDASKHLTQPAQAVDVVAWRYRLPNHPWCFTEKQPADYVSDAGVEVEPLTRAIGNAQAEGWSVPEGWRLVPIKPTVDMTEFGKEHILDPGMDHVRFNRAWAAALKAAPTPPTQATPNAHE